jgi:hypothetical protein
MPSHKQAGHTTVLTKKTAKYHYKTLAMQEPSTQDLGQVKRWCCQTTANQSHFSSNLNSLGRTEAAPLGKSGGTVQLEIRSTVKVALRVEVVVDCGVYGSEFL